MRANQFSITLLIATFLLTTLASSLTSNSADFLPRYLKVSKEYDGSFQLKVSRSPISSLLRMRGGGKKKETKKKKEKEAQPEEAVLDDFDEVSEADLEEPEEGAQQSQLMLSLTDMWVKTPPVTQVYVGASLLLTTLVFALNKNVWPEVLNLDWVKVVTRFQIWRPFTAFLFFGPLGLNYLLTIQFVWTYMAQLEKMNYKSPEDFLVMMTFGATTLTTLYAILGLSTKFLGHNLSTFLVYIWARIFEGTDVNVMDLFLLKAEVLPWFFCAQTLVLEGEVPFADLLGIVVGHFYHYLTKRKLLKAPDFVKAWFSTDSMKSKYLRFKDDFE